MRITLAQLNPVVGDLNGNLSKLANAIDQASQDSSDLLVLTELFLVGYPPKDLLERRWFIQMVKETIDKAAKLSKDYPKTGILFGSPLPTGKEVGKGLYNSALLMNQGKIISTYNKSLLPTYDVFDESRYFDPASDLSIISFKEEKIGISICEDAWNDPSLWPRGKFYARDPISELASKGATLFINISASPFEIGKEETRFRLIHSHAQRYKTPFVFVNQIGGNDELIFDGRSLCVDKNGEAIAVFPAWIEKMETIDTKGSRVPGLYKPQDRIESVHDALILGIQDYMRKCGFSKAVVGLSGGIDSALVCCLAKEALGGKNVLGISMPSPFSSKGSVEDSKKLAERIGIEFKTIPISSIYDSYLKILEEYFRGKEFDVTEENVQARIRGNILMAFSNKFGYLVLSTGNKSELAVGYCTLYGDMSGGLSVLSDVPKTIVYDLANYINRESEIIPKQIIKKAPSAELKPDQVDQDTLPPYPILDKILHQYIEEESSPEEIIGMGFDPETVKWVIRTVERNEYKRSQAAPGLKVTSKAFGVGRRMPIAAKHEF
jgi:NAD+ synthase (glutamine-hydrolysing)